MNLINDFKNISDLTDQDFYTEVCEDYEGNCRICPYKHECTLFVYNKQKINADIRGNIE